jgi:hypothetical protein
MAYFLVFKLLHLIQNPLEKEITNEHPIKERPILKFGLFQR